ncbi:hypothetical protein ACFWEO_02625 [Streptomyces roseolus]|uniref:hypothetical protein n=1 Tax=Streptomyces roseolus TaxID=67358 RepID=UPI00363B3FA7
MPGFRTSGKDVSYDGAPTFLVLAAAVVMLDPLLLVGGDEPAGRPAPRTGIGDLQGGPGADGNGGADGGSPVRENRSPLGPGETGTAPGSTPAPFPCVYARVRQLSPVRSPRTTVVVAVLPSRS